MTGVRRLGCGGAASLLFLAALVALIASSAWNGWSLISHRRAVAADMSAVLDEHGDVLEVELEPWLRAPTGSLCETIVQVTARLDTPREQVLKSLEARLRDQVEAVRLLPGTRVTARALLLHHGEFALFGCS